MSITLDSFYVLDALTEADNVARLGLPAPPEFGRANALFCPLGAEPARGWLLLTRANLQSLDINGAHTITFSLPGRALPLNGLYIVKARCLTPGAPADPNSCYLVEVADARHLLADPFLGVPANRQYQIRAPAYMNMFYTESLAANWDVAVGNLWGFMTLLLGSYPGMPSISHPLPEGFAFPGMSAWQALNQMLAYVGCAVKCDLTRPVGSQYSVVQVGAADTGFEALQNGFAKYRIFDAEFIEPVYAKQPAGVRVYFHRQNRYAGTEQATPIDNNQWVMRSVYNLDSVNPTGGGSPFYHPLWSHVPVLYDETETITNTSDLNASRDALAGDYFRMLNKPGGDRMQQIYSGPLAFAPGSECKGVCWFQDQLGIGDPSLPGGICTMIMRHPYLNLRVTDTGRWQWVCLEDSAPIRPPEFGPTVPIYPLQLRVVVLKASTVFGSDPNIALQNPDGTFDGVVQYFNSSTGTWFGTEKVWAIEMNLEAPVKAQRYPAILVGHFNHRPLWSFFTCPISPGGSSGSIMLKCCQHPPATMSLTVVLPALCATTLAANSDTVWNYDPSINGWRGNFCDKPSTLTCLEYLDNTAVYVLATADGEYIDYSIPGDYTDCPPLFIEFTGLAADYTFTGG